MVSARHCGQTARMPSSCLATTPTAGEGFLQILAVFVAAALLVASVMLLRRYFVMARMRSLQTWATGRGWALEAAPAVPDGLTSLPLWSRVESPRIANLCRGPGGVLIFDLEYLQVQVSGRDALGCTVVAIPDPRVELPPLRLIPDCWDPIDGPEPIRRGMSSGAYLGERSTFDDAAGRERRVGMCDSPELADLPTPYLLSDSGDGRSARMIPRLLPALEQADNLRFEAAGPWLIGYVDRRVATAELEDMITQVTSVATAVRAR